MSSPAHRSHIADEPGLRDIVLSHAAGANPQALDSALGAFVEETCVIGFDVLVAGGTEVEVSTVDLVWEHAGQSFETVIFVADRGPRYAQRYRERAAAAIGHDQVVTAVRAGLFDDRLLDDQRCRDWAVGA